MSLADTIVVEYVERGTIPAKRELKKAGPDLVFGCLTYVAEFGDGVRMHVLLEAACAAMPRFSEGELRRMLQLTTPLLNVIPPYGFALILEYLEQSDLTPGLCDDIRALEVQLKHGVRYFSAAGEQLFRQRLHLLRWLDGWDEIDLQACWSSAIRRELRIMPEEQRTKWRDLFKSFRADGIARMKPKTEKEASAKIESLGKDEFRLQIQRWFRPFSLDAPLSLTVAGSHVLKNLLLHCAVANDSEVTHAALWLLLAKWKAKKNVDKAMVALLQLIERMPAADAWQPLLELQENWGKADGQIEEALQRIGHILGVSAEELRARRVIRPERTTRPGILVSAAWIAVTLWQDEVVVQGSLGRYRVDVRTGRIVRESDGAVLLLDPSRLPPEVQREVNIEIPTGPDPIRAAARAMFDKTALFEEEHWPIQQVADREQVCIRVAMLEEDAVYLSAFVSLDNPLS
jgi:hypothetical protein